MDSSQAGQFTGKNNIPNDSKAFDLAEAGSEALYQISSVMKALLVELPADGDARRLVQVVKHLADDWGNFFDCEREDIQGPRVGVSGPALGGHAICRVGE
jgi:hypothetical protein